MALMPAGGKNPFTKLDKQSVIGALKATNSRDPDVLYSQKHELIAPGSHLKMLGMISMVIGALFTVTIILSWFGIPVVLFGYWCWSFGKKNMAAVEAGYSEYLSSIGVSASAAM